MVLVKAIICCVALVALASSSTVRNTLVVQTQNGPVQGREDSTVVGGNPFYSFRGIPYAEPPIGALRFQPPQPKTNWVDTLDATLDGPICVQGSEPVEGSEDCLTINVYTPERPSTTCERRPTLVWIFGGGFTGGDATYEQYGPDHLLDRGVSVVTFNYRLGILGFASTGDDVVPGNNGLKDQLLALQWVQNNIAAFCGDPNQITLGGQSAGSASVAFHIASPLSKGLFQRAILQSGVSSSLWSYSRTVPAIVAQLATNLGVNTSSSTSIVNGLRDIHITDLQTAAASTISSAFLAANPREGFPIGPTAEPNVPGAFFTGLSHENIVNGNISEVPILIGFNSLEGTYNFELAFRLFLIQFDRDNTKLLPPDMNIDPALRSAAASELKSFYFGWLPVSLSNTELMLFLSDDQFSRSIREFARSMQARAPVYFYRFSYEGGLWGIHSRNVSGVTHSEELGYYWVSKHIPLREHDLVVRDRLTTLWSNFITEGNPTPRQQALLQNLQWPTLGAQLNYVDIGENLVTTALPENARMQFWDSFYAKYGQPPYNTY